MTNQRSRPPRAGNDNRRNAGLHLFGRSVPLPQSRLLRVGLGVLLVLGGCLWFLPVVGFWMLPLGLIVLSIDIPLVRRWRRRFAVWFHTNYPGLARKLDGATPKVGPRPSPSGTQAAASAAAGASSTGPGFGPEPGPAEPALRRRDDSA
ncbi:hypothetical protein [Afifella sp. IM 167]|uniref:hypothetical protein n=1 Tax=Afifella sp. IM 167 TaxID=2033586 RepID=UPI001CCB70C3|nr:hypothetical protein [Afifella sp. IM 167]MBZ8132586.1 hypothetical protein [Afifella sp. IM 167]